MDEKPKPKQLIQIQSGKANICSEAGKRVVEVTERKKRIFHIRRSGRPGILKC
ncbi:MAG: hypothetical protein OCU22_05125 [Canidatus Methanoxibalbensis ujae]|nr:hypothetical protein [Candidatus Methanoxibalbensis ujae]